MVPPLASSNRPLRSAVAPVKEPLEWPNSSNSITPLGSAPQLTATNLSRLLLRWMIRANSSLPDPVSPSSRTVSCDGAIRAMRSRLAAIWWLEPRTPSSSRISRLRDGVTGLTRSWTAFDTGGARVQR